MQRIIENVADLLMYSGPNIKEIINNALENGKDFKIEQNNGINILIIKAQLPYGIEVTDKYFYNEENQLIKQILYVKNKEKIIFDKYCEATKLLSKLEDQSTLVS